MGEPDYAEQIPAAGLSLIYYSVREKNHTVYNAIYDDEALIADLGVKLIGIEYDEPIENTFK